MCTKRPKTASCQQLTIAKHAHKHTHTHAHFAHFSFSLLIKKLKYISKEWEIENASNGSFSAFNIWQYSLIDCCTIVFRVDGKIMDEHTMDAFFCLITFQTIFKVPIHLRNKRLIVTSHTAGEDTLLCVV